MRNWDAQRGLFVLAFDNGSVEPAYLPQPSVKIVDARGTVLDWESFFNYCRSVGMCVPTRPKPVPLQLVFRYSDPRSRGGSLAARLLAHPLADDPLNAASVLSTADCCANHRSHLGSALDGDDDHDAGRTEMNTASVEEPITSAMAGVAGHGLGVSMAVATQHLSSLVDELPPPPPLPP